MKKKSNFDYLTSILLISFVIYFHGPSVVNNYKFEGTKISEKNYLELKSKKNILFPPAGNSIVIFWATWCAPCKLEMNRLKKSVIQGKIPKENIFAINPFENPVDFSTFLKKENFPFNFIEAPELVKKLNIDKTPTTLFIYNYEIESMSSGLSLIGIWRAENLFSNHF